jgi:glutamate-1-semialdehyde aminotransferase
MRELLTLDRGRLGALMERGLAMFASEHPRGDVELERFLHLLAMNRRIVMAPFHNMALRSPATTEVDVDRHTEVFASAVDELFAV